MGCTCSVHEESGGFSQIWVRNILEDVEIEVIYKEILERDVQESGSYR